MQYQTGLEAFYIFMKNARLLVPLSAKFLLSGVGSRAGAAGFQQTLNGAVGKVCAGQRYFVFLPIRRMNLGVEVNCDISAQINTTQSVLAESRCSLLRSNSLLRGSHRRDTDLCAGN